MERDTTGRFKEGSTPWNKGSKGLMKPNKTSFVKGQESKRKVPIGSIRIRIRKKRNDTRKFIKIGEPNKWRENAIYIWEKENGRIPKGFIIHHKDRNKLNDSIENLEILSRSQHLNEHRKEHNEQKRGESLRKE